MVAEATTNTAHGSRFQTTQANDCAEKSSKSSKSSQMIVKLGEVSYRIEIDSHSSRNVIREILTQLSLKQIYLREKDIYFKYNQKTYEVCADELCLEKDLRKGHFLIIEIFPKLRGGKGGYGAMMKNEAATKKKFVDCYNSKDLKGRRIRDIRNGVDLRKWIKKNKHKQKELDHEREKFRRRKEKIRQMKIKSQVQREGGVFRKQNQDWNSQISTSVRKAYQKKKKLKMNREMVKVFDQDLHEEILEEDLKTEKLITDRVQDKLEKDTSTELDNDLEKQEPDPESIEVNDCIPETVTLKQPEIPDKSIKIENIELESIVSLEKLKKRDPASLKFTLKNLGMKCGGSPQQRAIRLWEIKNDPTLMFSKKYRAKK